MMNILIADDSPTHRAGLSLSLKVVAEGVETEEQANLLRLLKCDEFQGFLFSPAVPAEQVELLLRENKSPPK